MKYLNISEVEDWLRTRSLWGSDGRLWLRGQQKYLYCRIPSDAGRKTALSRQLMSLFGSSGGGLAWVREYGIWPSSQDLHLFDQFRKSLDCPGRLPELPGHEFDASDRASIQSILAMALYFAWGMVLVSNDQRILVEVSHDEIVEVFLAVDALQSSSDAEKALRGLTTLAEAEIEDR